MCNTSIFKANKCEHGKNAVRLKDSIAVADILFFIAASLNTVTNNSLPNRNQTLVAA